MRKKLLRVMMLLVLGLVLLRQTRPEIETSHFPKTFAISRSTGNGCWKVSLNDCSDRHASLNTGASVYSKTKFRMIDTNLLAVSSGDIGDFVVGMSDDGTLFQVPCEHLEQWTFLKADAGCENIDREPVVVKLVGNKFFPPKR